MEMTVEISFQQLLDMVRKLTPSQKGKLEHELAIDDSKVMNKDAFIELLLNGPVFLRSDINRIIKNRKSINAWRTKKLAR